MKQRLLLVGTNDRETKFRVLEIDRTAGTELKFREYTDEYDAKGIRQLVGTIGQCKVSFPPPLAAIGLKYSNFRLFNHFIENQCIRRAGFHSIHGKLLHDFGDQAYEMCCNWQACHLYDCRHGNNSCMRTICKAKSPIGAALFEDIHKH